MCIRIGTQRYIWNAHQIGCTVHSNSVFLCFFCIANTRALCFFSLSSIVDHKMRIVLPNIIGGLSRLHLFGLCRNGYFHLTISETNSHYEISRAHTHNISITFYLLVFHCTSSKKAQTTHLFGYELYQYNWWSVYCANMLMPAYNNSQTTILFYVLCKLITVSFICMNCKFLIMDSFRNEIGTNGTDFNDEKRTSQNKEKKQNWWQKRRTMREII